MKMKAGMSHLLSLMIIMALTVLPLSLDGQGTRTDFSGTWVYNAEKSNTGQASGQGQGRGGFAGGDFTVKQDANLLTVERIRTNPEGQSSTITTKYTLDGTESLNSSQRGDSRSVASWSSDGKVLTIKTTRTMTRDGESRTLTTTEVYSLSDSKTLNIEITSPSPEGERKVTAVYNKK